MFNPLYDHFLNAYYFAVLLPLSSNLAQPRPSNLALFVNKPAASGIHRSRSQR
jgi:hypothetical protein